MPSPLSLQEMTLAFYEIKVTFKNLTANEWELLDKTIWKMLLGDIPNSWVKAKLYALPDTGDFWKDRLASS